MGLIDDIGRMQAGGSNETEIRNSLRQRGISDPEIDGAMSQVMIKGEVDRNYGLPSEQGYQAPMPGQPYFPAQGMDTQVASQSYDGMEPSLMTQEQQYQEGEFPQEGGDVSGAGFGSQFSYQPYQEAMSSDVISEIAEQVVAEKLSMLNEKIEQVINFGNVADAKLKNFEERIDRIEKIFDKLQLSILQRVAEYVDNVRDLKTELQETQKSFKAIVSKRE